MDSFLGIAGLDVNGVGETHWTVEASVNSTDRAVCPKCGPHGRMESKGKANPKRVMDTPTRGKPTALTIHRRRFTCLVCRRSVTEPGPLVDDSRKATLRLIRYVQNQVTMRPIAHVARETGMPASTVRDIALDLACSLEEHHRFPTPRVLGMDGLKLNGIEYMVIGDADSGDLIGIVQQASTVEVRRWMKTHAFDAAAVEVFVTDMHSVNVSLAGKELKGALHVADKWHIIKNFQAAISRIVDKAVHDLRAGNEKESIEPNPALAQAIDDLKPAIMSVSHSRLRKRRRHKKGEQMVLDFGRDLKPYLDKVESISRAYWARHDLISMYHCETERDALACLDRFLERVEPLAHIDAVQNYINHLRRNHRPIFNYFLARSGRPNGKVRGPTTNTLEQRNSMIRKIWRSGNGIRTLPLLRLRAIYGQWEIGTEIVECTEPGCERILGPLAGPPCPPALAGVTTAGPRCRAHAV